VHARKRIRTTHNSGAHPILCLCHSTTAAIDFFEHERQKIGVGWDVAGRHVCIGIVYEYNLRWEAGGRKGEYQEMERRVP
jgi:hypothetical protein